MLSHSERRLPAPRQTPFIPYLTFAPRAWVLPLKFTGGGLSPPGKLMIGCVSLFVLKGYGYVISKMFNNAPAQVFRFPLTKVNEPVNLRWPGGAARCFTCVSRPKDGLAGSVDGAVLPDDRRDASRAFRRQFFTTKDIRARTALRRSLLPSRLSI